MHSLKRPPPVRLRIPVVVTLPKFSDLEKHLQEAMKQDLGKAEKSLAKSLGATVWWDPLEWEFNGNSLTAHVHVHAKNLQAKGSGTDHSENGLETIAQDVEKDMKVDLSTAVKWTKDFQLEAPDFLEGDTATASVTEADGKKAERLVRKGTSKFHESLKQKTHDILAKAKEFWVKIQEPIRIAEDTWLQIRPDRLSVGASHLVADPAGAKLVTVFEFVGQPNIFIGEKPRVTIIELPPLKGYESGPEGFHIERNLRISFKEVNKLLVDPKTGILNKVLPGGGGHNLKITQLNLYGSGGQLVVEAEVQYQPVIDLSGKPSQLTIYLLGTPTYHEDEQIIDFPDMDFDIKTNDFLVQVAEFISGSGMRDELRKRAVISVGKYLGEAKEEMTKLLNRPLGSHARLRTTITSLKMEEAFISDYGIEGRVALDGDVNVDVDW